MTGDEPPTVEIYDHETRVIARAKFVRSLASWFAKQAVEKARLLVSSVEFVAQMGSPTVSVSIDLDQPPDNDGPIMIDRNGLVDLGPFSVLVTVGPHGKPRFEIIEDGVDGIIGIGLLILPGIACTTVEEDKRLGEEITNRLKAGFDDNGTGVVEP